MTYRKVLENDGNRLLVELEQLGRWRFLVFSGSFASRIFIEQNRREHLVSVNSNENFRVRLLGIYIQTYNLNLVDQLQP